MTRAQTGTRDNEPTNLGCRRAVTLTSLVSLLRVRYNSHRWRVNAIGTLSPAKQDHNGSEPIMLDGDQRAHGKRLGPADVPAGRAFEGDSTCDDTASLIPGSSGDSSSARLAAAHLPTIEGYQITGILGQGGMGTVYRAVQVKLNRIVALKVLHAVVAAGNPTAVTRFRREATAAARLHHTNIVPIYDFGECADGYFYAMELISGHTLDVLICRLFDAGAPTAAPHKLVELLQTATRTGASNEAPCAPSTSGDTRDGTTTTTSFGGRGCFYFHQVAAWMADVADALGYAHDQGIIHRDIKPSNLILSNDGRIMVADFGLAKSSEAQSVTMTGSLMGTLRYMSPEQAMARRVRLDHRTDVYSLGATMYELICFRPAFEGNDDKEILGAIISREPTSPRRLNAHIPAELVTICLKCLEKSADARYDTAAALADDLRRYTRDLPIAARRPSIARRCVKFVRRHKARVVAVTAVVLLVVATISLTGERGLRREAERDRDVFTVEAHYESAMGFAILKKWGMADKEFARALDANPRHLRSFVGLAWLRLEQYKSELSADPNQRLLEDAVGFCKEALRINPAQPIAYAYLGVAQRRLGRYHAAIPAFESAIAGFKQTETVEPQEATSWSNLGALYVIQEDFPQALQCLQKGAELAGTLGEEYRAGALRNLATLEVHLGLEDALEHIERALNLYREDPLAWALKARALLASHDAKKLRDAKEAATTADLLARERNARIKRVRAIAHFRVREFDQAIEHAAEAQRLGDRVVFEDLIRALVAARTGDFTTAQRHLETASKNWPPELAQREDVEADAETGDLWIDAAEELFRMRDEARRLIALG